jgi:hypothetical protein
VLTVGHSRAARQPIVAELFSLEQARERAFVGERGCSTQWTTQVSLVPLPPRAPELNGHIWQFMRQNWLSNRIFKSFDDIVDHCCYAWNTLIEQPWKIMSIA